MVLTLNYQIEISASPARVWFVLTDLEQYCQWARAFSPHSTFRGDWHEGHDMLFYDPDMGGTRAVVDVCRPIELLEYHHVEVLSPEFHQQSSAVIDREVIDKWLGTRERYQLIPTETGLLLNVTITTHRDFGDLFDHGWHRALPMIKSLCETANC